MNRRLVAPAAAALLLASATAALAQGGPYGQGRPYGTHDGLNRWMTVNNFSHNAMAINIYIIPAGASCCWSRDLLGASVIPPGRSFNVNFNNGSRACVFDIRITSQDPRRDWTFNRIDVCSNTALNLR